MATPHPPTYTDPASRPALPAHREREIARSKRAAGRMIGQAHLARGGMLRLSGQRPILKSQQIPVWIERNPVLFEAPPRQSTTSIPNSNMYSKSVIALALVSVPTLPAATPEAPGMCACTHPQCMHRGPAAPPPPPTTTQPNVEQTIPLERAHARCEWPRLPLAACGRYSCHFIWQLGSVCSRAVWAVWRGCPTDHWRVQD